MLRQYTTSTCMALLDKQVYRVPYLLTSSNHPLQERTKQVHPTVHKWWFLSHSLLGKICQFLLLKSFSQLLAPDTLQDDTADQTKELHLVIPKLEDFIWFIVMPQPAWANCSWHQCTTNSENLNPSPNS